MPTSCGMALTASYIQKRAAGTRRSTPIKTWESPWQNFRRCVRPWSNTSSPLTTTCAPIASAPRNRSIAGSGCSKSPPMPSATFNRFARSKPILTFPRAKSGRTDHQESNREEANVSNHTSRALPVPRAWNARTGSAGSTQGRQNQRFGFHGSARANVYLMKTPAGNVVIDTGIAGDAPEARKLLGAESHSAIKYIVLTHGHADHIGGIDLWKEPGTQIIAQRNYVELVNYVDRLDGF